MRARSRKPPVAVTPYLIEAIRQASLSETQAEIATRLRVAQATVSRIQRREGIPHFDRSSGQRFATERRKQAQRGAVALVVAKVESIRRWGL
jgi:hypothetical protein